MSSCQVYLKDRELLKGAGALNVFVVLVRNKSERHNARQNGKEESDHSQRTKERIGRDVDCRRIVQKEEKGDTTCIHSFQKPSVLVA